MHVQGRVLSFVVLSIGALAASAVIVDAAPDGQAKSPAHPVTRLVSKAANGQHANATAAGVRVSAHCTAVGFESLASNLVPGDTNGSQDVFVRNRRPKSLVLASSGPHGRQADDSSRIGDLSPDGRVVGFVSGATNLVAGDVNDALDVFVRDLRKHRPELISAAAGGGPANGESLGGSLSWSGELVAFSSEASTIVADDANGGLDVFVRNRTKQKTVRVSVGVQGEESNGDSTTPSISGSGRYIAFESSSTNLVEGDANGSSDVFRYDRASGSTDLVSVTPGGDSANGASFLPDMSTNGRFVSFTSLASDLVEADTVAPIDVYVRDMSTGTTTLVSVSSAGDAGDNASGFATVSNQGAVSFQSDATNLIGSDTNLTADVFLHSLATATTRLISVSTTGRRSNGNSFEPSVSADGRCVGFSSNADNLIGNDTNQGPDAFLRRLMKRPQ
jgi:Tol biopolymer transport system component